MSRNNQPEKPKKLQLMVKLQYGEDYSGFFWLGIFVTIGVFIVCRPIAWIASPLFFFYLAALQLYSGIGLGIWDVLWAGRGKYAPIIAKYRRGFEPTLFYVNVYICLFLGILVFCGAWQLFVALYR